jgi:structural maintenance of chromosome 3 (chondroitin sulfate proteoglycan 6)
VEQLYGKQGRGKQFDSKAERNAFLDEQIGTLNTQVEAKEALVSRAKEQMKEQEGRQKKEGSAIAAAEKDAKSHGSSHETNNRAIRDAIVKRNELQEQRKDSWRQMEEVQESLNEAKQELDRAKQNLNASLPKQVALGLRVAERLAQEMQLEGYYGPLMNNFTLKSEAFRTAVEVAVGNALFHVIVDTDKTAAMLIKEMEKRKQGRLTFIPLNRIQQSEVKYPDSNDVRPMMEVALDYDEAFAPAMKHVFGKKLLARDLEVASHFSREYNLDAITRDGDQVNRKGGFEGGYHDDRVSRISAALKIQKSNATIGDLLEREQEMKAGAENVEQAMNQIVRDLQKLEGERDRSKGLLEAIAKEIGPRKSAMQAAADALEARKRNLAGVEEEVTALKEKRQQFRKEKDSPLKDSLDSREKAELQQLAGEERSMQTGMEALEEEMSSITLQRQKLRHDLTDNFNRRSAEIEARLTSVRLEMDDEDVAESSSLRLERENTISVAKALESELDAAEASLIAKRAEAQETQKKLETVKVDDEKLSRIIDEAAKMHDKLMNKRTMLMETVQTKSRQIRDLGTLPRAEAEESSDLAEKQLLARIATVQEALKKFPGVNRKALDQYVSFNEQRKSLVERKEAAESESTSIQKLVDSLDIKKEEAILRTFKGVSKHFADVFSELVKDGKGQLIMRTSEDEEDEGGEDLAALVEEIVQGQGTGEEKQSSPAKKGGKGKKGSKGAATEEGVAAAGGAGAGAVAAAPAAPSISTFRGVQVRVSFSGAGQTFEMKQLSGGQKALVALALIFAIQRCDPAPFYLFDEIDQALDANYRAAVAHLIAKQAADPENPTQFITTTFRPEMVEVADKHYGIALVNKASNIYPLTKGDAENFVSNMMLEEEKVGEVTSIAKFDAAGTSAPAAAAAAAAAAGPGPVAAPGPVQKEALDDDVDEDVQRGQYGAPEDSDDDDEEGGAGGAGAKSKSRAAAIDKEMGVTVEEGGEGMDEEEEEDDLSEDEVPAGKGAAGARASKKRKPRVRGSLRA